MASRTYKERLEDKRGLDWDLLQAFENFGREAAVPGFERCHVSVDLKDGKYSGQSVAEARRHGGEVKSTFAAVIVTVYAKKETTITAAVTTVAGFVPTSFDFEGPDQTLVLGLKESWRRRLDDYKAAPVPSPSPTPLPAKADATLLRRAFNHPWVVGTIIGLLVAVLVGVVVLVTVLAH